MSKREHLYTILMGLLAAALCALVVTDRNATRKDYARAVAVADSAIAVNARMRATLNQQQWLLDSLRRLAGEGLDAVRSRRAELGRRTYPAQRARLDSLTQPLDSTAAYVRGWLKGKSK